MASLIYRVFTLNFLFLSRIHYEFFIFFANSLSIHYLFGEFTMAPLIFRVFTLNLLFLSRIHYQFTICSRTHYESINFPRIHFEFTIFFVFTLWIHYLLRQFVTLSVSRLIHYFFRKFSLYLLSLREITMDPISFREFTIYFFMLYDEITTWQLNNN